jgi:4-hydroxythreonine-4-phosphate dehydrogenase
MNKKVIAISMGDPAGIGPLVTIKALKYFTGSQKFDYSNFIVIGNKKILYELNDKHSLYDKLDKLNIVGVETAGIEKIEPGKISPYSGRASYEYIKAAADLVKTKAADALVTAPISKDALRLAGIDYCGHTEILQALCGVKKVEMAFYGSYFNLFLITRHIALSKALKIINAEVIYKAIINAAVFMRQLFPKTPAIDIIAPGLNPHASENGLFGDEEERIIIPAVIKARGYFQTHKSFDGINVTGPEPADTAFYLARKSPRKTILLSYYHDQGLAPFKMLHFETGVNVTLGLPFIRTSPDHGTALAIAACGTACPVSMINAIKLAFKLKPVELI